ncbi:FliM/FliN family flagellar motor switch protein [Chitinibacteraceae bacterium HSL-7]
MENLIFPLHLYTVAEKSRLQQVLTQRLQQWALHWGFNAHTFNVELLDSSSSSQESITMLRQDGEHLLLAGEMEKTHSWVLMQLLGQDLPPGPVPNVLKPWVDDAWLALWSVLTGRGGARAILLSSADIRAEDGEGLRLGLTSARGGCVWVVPQEALTWGGEDQFASPASFVRWTGLLDDLEQRVDCFLPTVHVPLSSIVALVVGDTIVFESSVQRTRIQLRALSHVLAECEVSGLSGYSLRVLHLIDQEGGHIVNENGVSGVDSLGWKDLAAASPGELGRGSSTLVDPLKYVADIEVAVEFRVGEAKLSIGALRALKPGSTIPLLDDRGLVVDILLRGHLVGQGVLVDAGGLLGVQVTLLSSE